MVIHYQLILCLSFVKPTVRVVMAIETHMVDRCKIIWVQYEPHHKKTCFCICEKRAADQRIRFRFIHSLSDETLNRGPVSV